jgi:NitT/TauT family transport system substrate-binding protein
MNKNVKATTSIAVLLIVSFLILAGCSSTGKGSASGKPETVRYSEVIRSIFYAPQYLAMEKGFFKEEGIIVDSTTAQGSDKGAAALLAGSADVALIGPETTIYIFNQNGGKTLKVFHQLTTSDGSFLMSREKKSDFKWSDLQGKQVIGWRPGSAPQMVLSTVLKENKVTGADVVTNIASTAMVGAFTSGKGDYIQVYEPNVSILEDQGKAFVVASLGEAKKDFPETSFVATSDYIKKNPQLIEKWVRAVTKATQWIISTDSNEVAKMLLPYFEGSTQDQIKKSVDRYKKQNTWIANPELKQSQFDNLQNVLVDNGTLKAEQKVTIDDIYDGTFAKQVGKGAK